MEPVTDFSACLAASGARFDDAGHVTGFGDTLAEQRALEQSAIVVPLLPTGLIRVSGEDACAFLNGQLTSDVSAVTVENVQYSGYCTPKGRLLATMLIFMHDGAYHLLLPQELARDIRSRLQRYVLRSKVKLADCTNDFIVFGVTGTQGSDSLSASGLAPGGAAFTMCEAADALVISLPGRRHLVICRRERAEQTWDKLCETLTPAGAGLWALQTIRSGIATVTPATQEAFIPQMLALDSYHAVSFDKGCYPGQEIVARTRYLGDLKRSLSHGHCDTAVMSGDTIVTASGKTAGTVVNAAQSDAGQWEFLAVMQRDALNAGETFATASGGSVVLLQTAESLLDRTPA